MAITSELIGKFGGAEVEVVSASVTLGTKGATEVIHTLNIPSGETWLVAVVGTGIAGSSEGPAMPRINIGGMKVPQNTGHFASAAVMTERGDVVLESNSYNPSSFEGHVYTVKMELDEITGV